MLDLAAYFARIGYKGETSATLNTLQQLHALHTQSIAFENLSPFLGATVYLDAEALSSKLIRGGRGGWCFEHNLLFKQVLEQLGFTVTGLAARVRLTLDDTVPAGTSPCTHMLLLVQADDVSFEDASFIADVGFGGLTLTTPLRLQADFVQASSHERVRLLLNDGVYRLQARLVNLEGAISWKSLYDFDLHPQHQTDYALTNWYLSHHPESMFVNNLLAARAAPGRRHALFNTRYTVHFLDGQSKTYDLPDVKALLQTLREIFHIRLVPSARLEEGLARLFQMETAED